MPGCMGYRLPPPFADTLLAIREIHVILTTGYCHFFATADIRPLFENTALRILAFPEIIFTD